MPTFLRHETIKCNMTGWGHHTPVSHSTDWENLTDESQEWLLELGFSNTHCHSTIRWKDGRCLIIRKSGPNAVTDAQGVIKEQPQRHDRGQWWLRLTSVNVTAPCPNNHFHVVLHCYFKSTNIVSAVIQKPIGPLLHTMLDTGSYVCITSYVLVLYQIIIFKPADRECVLTIDCMYSCTVYSCTVYG